MCHKGRSSNGSLETKMSNAKLWRDGEPQATNDRGGQLELGTMSKQQQSLSVAHPAFQKQHHP